MTRAEFQKLPHLVMKHNVAELGINRATLAKYVDCGVLLPIAPAGSGQVWYQKKQLAQLLEWTDLLDVAGFAREKPLLDAKDVRRWTGWSLTTITKMATAGGLHAVKPAGSVRAKFRKQELARLLGLEQLV